MKVRLFSLLLLAAMTGSGCYYEAHTSGPADGLTGDSYPGSTDITFSWSFDGKGCAQAGVVTVVVDMPGQWLQNNGRYPCSSSGYEGITLANFLPGTYPYTLYGYDASGALRYQGSGSITLDERVCSMGITQFAKVDLGSTAVAPGGSGDVGATGDGGTLDAGSTPPPPDAGAAGAPDAGGGAYDAGMGGGCGCHLGDAGTDAGTFHNDVSWTFQDVPNAPTCGDELAAVVLTIDGQSVTHECGAGLYPSRVSLPTLTPGTHALEIDAVDSTGRSWASNSVSITIPSGADSYNTYPLTWTVGSAAVDWTFYSCDGVQTYPSCDAAQVETLGINFQDCSGNWLWADDHNYPLDQQVACSTANGATVIRAVTPGCYTTFLAGYGTRASGIVYDEYPGQSAYPLTVRAGVFFTATSPASDFVSVELYQRPQ